MNFKKLLTKAQAGDMTAIQQITDMYKPLMLKESIIEGALDEDLFQEIWLTLMNCIEKIDIDA